ncbi:hypothetical protein CHS0354_025518 [Potamilus streckersoni]|uniref:Uncharacterized protein n=1 Tax=Potamilus streckersoni TaxID=2493646 RepID=A0AAE0VYH2_9BIVA|nr:hypothetical protein CHS0354_025518 [Potamilus streckersoni]
MVCDYCDVGAQKEEAIRDRLVIETLDKDVTEKPQLFKVSGAKLGPTNQNEPRHWRKPNHAGQTTSQQTRYKCKRRCCRGEKNPAKGNRCRRSNKLNQYAIGCRSRRVNEASFNGTSAIYFTELQETFFLGSMCDDFYGV